MGGRGKTRVSDLVPGRAVRPGGGGEMTEAERRVVDAAMAYEHARLGLDLMLDDDEHDAGRGLEFTIDQFHIQRDNLSAACRALEAERKDKEPDDA